MNFMSRLYDSLPKASAVVGAASGWAGAQTAQGVVHCVVPPLIKQNVIRAAQVKFGSMGGYIIGNTLAPTAIAQAMSYAIPGAGLLGGMGGAAMGILACKGLGLAGGTALKIAKFATVKVQNNINGRNYLADTTSNRHAETLCVWSNPNKDKFKMTLNS